MQTVWLIFTHWQMKGTHMGLAHEYAAAPSWSWSTPLLAFNGSQSAMSSQPTHISARDLSTNPPSETTRTASSRDTSRDVSAEHSQASVTLSC